MTICGVWIPNAAQNASKINSGPHFDFSSVWDQFGNDFAPFWFFFHSLFALIGSLLVCVCILSAASTPTTIRSHHEINTYEYIYICMYIYIYIYVSFFLFVLLCSTTHGRWCTPRVSLSEDGPASTTYLLPKGSAQTRLVDAMPQQYSHTFVRSRASVWQSQGGAGCSGRSRLGWRRGADFSTAPF